MPCAIPDDKSLPISSPLLPVSASKIDLPVLSNPKSNPQSVKYSYGVRPLLYFST